MQQRVVCCFVVLFGLFGLFASADVVGILPSCERRFMCLNFDIFAWQSQAEEGGKFCIIFGCSKLEVTLGFVYFVAAFVAKFRELSFSLSRCVRAS